MLRRLFKTIFGLIFFGAAAASILSFIVGFAGFLMSDEKYKNDIDCGVDFICSLSQVHYQNNLFLVALTGFVLACTMLFIGVAVDDKFDEIHMRKNKSHSESPKN